ncbi:MAG: hypothetical protein WC701_01855 [Kiritimatiellales bacterium]|jgi:hypothetical protein
MSLIQDALKRQAEEQPVVRPPVMPVQPVEQPGPPADGKNIQPFPLKLTVTLITALAVVLTGLGIYLIKPKPRVPPPVIQKPVPVIPVAAAPAAVIPAIPVPVAVPAAPVPAVETVKVETVAEPVRKEAPAPEIKPVWPELRLTGIAQNNSQSIAVLNGKMLCAGRKLGEVLVKEVHDSDVVVEYSGECRTLYIDE